MAQAQDADASWALGTPFFLLFFYYTNVHSSSLRMHPTPLPPSRWDHTVMTAAPPFIGKKFQPRRHWGTTSRIFERGLDFFGDEIDYVLRYLSFLISINDENSKFFFFLFSISSICPMLMWYILIDARALFERVIPNFSADRARPLWERWARYEYQYGDLEAALKLEKRMAEVYVSGMIFLLFSLFFRF